MIYSKIIQLINASLEVDGGNSYRAYLQQVLPHISDAYRPETDRFRTHLGASVLGEDCLRKVWYGFHWYGKETFPGRILRLFNRGHLEEGRIIALLLSAGLKVYQQDAEGRQYRFKALGGHLGGSTDGVLMGVPEFPNTPCLAEVKTHNDASFVSLKAKGVAISKPQHYSQMTLYMQYLGLRYGLYIAVNKNDDELYAEIIELSESHCGYLLDRAKVAVFSPSPPKGISNSPGAYACKFCPFKSICFNLPSKIIDFNCRTCSNSEARPDGTWHCNKYDFSLDKNAQLLGCSEYEERK